MRCWIIKRNRLIEVGPSLGEVTRKEHGCAHHAVANHEWGCCSLFFGECQEFVCKVAYNITIACYITPNPEAVEDQEQQQRVFGSSSRPSAFSINRRACSTAFMVLVPFVLSRA